MPFLSGYWHWQTIIHCVQKKIIPLCFLLWLLVKLTNLHKNFSIYSWMNTDYKCLKIFGIYLLYILCYWWRNCQLIPICQWWELTLKVSTWPNLCKKIRNMEQHDKGFPKMFPNKNWSLGGLKVLIKKIDNRGTVRTVRCRPLPDTCVVNFFISTFSPARLQFLLGNILSNRLAPYFLFSGFFFWTQCISDNHK